MFSVIFPGQGSQIVGMGKELYDKYDLVKNLFDKADDALNYSISKIILEGPKEELDLTANTQPAIYLISYSIFNLAKKEFNLDLNKAKYFAGHSLGEYSALSCAGYLDFSDTLKILRIRGDAMQNSVPKGQGGMVAVLGSTVDEIERILMENKENLKAQIANDNSEGQIVLSGKTKDLEQLIQIFKTNSIKNIKLPVSAPFHCELMRDATIKMEKIIQNQKFNFPKFKVISNVTAKDYKETEEIKKLLIKQIESPVRWRESIEYMISQGSSSFIEIGPGKVLSGLIKRINKEVKVLNIDRLEDIQDIKL